MKKNHLHIGILGLGSRATIFYIKQLNYKYNILKKGYSTYPFKLLNTDFNEINPFLPDNFKQLKKNLLPYFDEIETFNINNLLIPNITLHQTIDLLEIDSKYNFSVIHPVKNTVEQLDKNNQNEVVLFGSLHSMKTSYITSYFLKNDIDVLLPTEAEMNFIDNFRQKVYFNKESKNEINQYNKLVKSYATKNAVVIACTELSLILDETISNVYDMARIQIYKALK